jgi:bifunctional DNA-binding transcriptional regulator/antitoxin component of YhaV-PrlF toxin-antitoxin module
MEEIKLKLDSKGRLYIPPEIREEIGDTVILRRTSKGFLLTKGSSSNFLEEFRKVIISEPPRTGNPENWSPKKIKTIWEKSR